jgi:hypothetical protein
MHKLQILSSRPFELVWHENRKVYISMRRKGGLWQLRLHRLFHDAPTPVLEAILEFVFRGNPSARTIIRQMAHLHFSKVKQEPTPLESQGNVYDLQEIFNRLNVFGLSDVTIGWGKGARFSRFRSMTFGVFDPVCRQIRMNPLLDDAQVPLYFIEFIVYHELLHALIPTKMGQSGRCSIHSAEFKAKERQFPRFAEAKVWEKGSLEFFRRRYGRP